MPVPGPRLKPEVVTPAEMVKQVSVKHHPDKGGTDQNVKAVKSRSDEEHSTVGAVSKSKGRLSVLQSLQASKI